MNAYVPNTRYAFHQDGRLFCESRGWAAVLRIWPEPTISITHSGGHWAKTYESGTAPRDLGSRVLRLALDMAERPDFYGDVIDGPEDSPQLPLPGFIQYPIHRYLPELEHIDDAFIHRAHLRCFLETLPPGLRALMAFPHYAPWQLLKVFTNCPRAGDLATANPVLFSYLLSHFLSTYSEEEPPYDRMDSWLDCRQVEIMDYLGLPASESDRRILMKTSRDAPRLVKDVYEDEPADEIEPVDQPAQPEAADHTLVFDFDPQLPLLPREQLRIVRAVSKAFSGLATA